LKNEDFGPGCSPTLSFQVFSSGSEYYRLAWFNRSGKISGTLGSQERYGSLRIAPDATQAAVVVANNSGARDISTIDFARGVLSRISNGSVIIHIATLSTLSAPSNKPDNTRVPPTESTVFWLSATLTEYMPTRCGHGF
jgi:hypothetical protein